MRGLSLVAGSGGHSSSRCAGLSLSRPLRLRSTGSRRADSVVVAHGPSCSAACGIFPDQGSNPCALHWQADSQPLRHQGSPAVSFWHKMNLDISRVHKINRFFFFFCNALQGYSEVKVKGKIKYLLFVYLIVCVFYCIAPTKVRIPLHLTTKSSDNYKNLPRNL